MMKKTLILFCALALSLTPLAACNNKKNDPEDTGANTQVTDTTDPETPTGIADTDDATESTTPTEAPTTAPDTTSEPSPVFTDISKQLFVFVGRATIRTNTIVEEASACAWPAEGTILEATGESTNWYRINHGGAVRYISKNVVCDNALLEGFTEVNETITISKNVNVRVIPTTAYDNTVRAILHAGDTVTRIGIGQEWSCILYEEINEAETDADGQPVKVIKHYYISNDCIVTAEESDTTVESATEAPAA